MLATVKATKNRTMIKVNSISGGKTSAFMALNYHANIELFALVFIEAENCKPKDNGLVKFVSDKIGRDFVATAESDKTLYVVRDLEQLSGSRSQRSMIESKSQPIIAMDINQ